MQQVFFIPNKPIDNSEENREIYLYINFKFKNLCILDDIELCFVTYI